MMSRQCWTLHAVRSDMLRCGLPMPLRVGPKGLLIDKNNLTLSQAKTEAANALANDVKVVADVCTRQEEAALQLLAKDIQTNQ